MNDIVTKEMVDSGLLDKTFTNYNDDGYEVSQSGKSYELTCFEDIYLSLRAGVWMQSDDDLIEFRKDAALTYGEPAEALSFPETIGEIQAMTDFSNKADEDEDEDGDEEDAKVMTPVAKPVPDDD